MLAKGVFKGTIRIHCNCLNHTPFELFYLKPIVGHIDWRQLAIPDSDKQLR